MTIDKSYQPLELEKKWYQFWESEGYFTPKPADQSYCIMLPPPNVTGTLHMGHAFQDTIMDALIRYHRMQGCQTLWQAGTDHAGIATQMVVERQLQMQNTTRHELGREKFVEKVWEWKESSGNTITNQMRRLGASIDWSRERFTMDEGLSKAVTEVFVRLHNEGLIYRGKRLVNWDPKLHTAISDLEVISEEENGYLWHIRYPLANNDQEFLVVATTRPETMLGDTAVAVHPQDSRYQHLIGQSIALPLTNRLIPIIADDYVDPSFGTGCVKITPAHDFNDHEIGKRHHLEMINIFTIDAIVNANAPAAYQGLTRFEARERIIHDLKAAQLLEKIEPHQLKIPRGDRSGEIVEPYLTNQWFVDVKAMAQEAIEVVKTKKIQFIPPVWEKTYFDWMENIQDWCISRQLWWGHRIPAWYDAEENIYVAHTKEEAIRKYNLAPTIALTQDNDVLDTWFSSALWPFSTLGWPNEPNEINQYYPTNVLVTGFDIIFFWVARMIMMGTKFTKAVPFKEVYVHGLIQDAMGQKMSKSKGNVLDPIDIIDGIDLESLVQKRLTGLMQPHMAKQIETQTRKEYPQGIPSFGTDALRFTFAALASNNRFIRFDLARVDGNRHFCNKLWNAARYVFMNLEGQTIGDETERELTINEKWIWSLWQKSKEAVHENFKHYRFDLVSQTLYEFIWNQYCDWYLEISKPMLRSENENIRNGTRFTLVAILEEILRAIHPIMPFISEEIWQKLVPILDKSYFSVIPQSIMLQPFPKVDANRIDPYAEKALGLTSSFIVAIRTIRAEMNIHPGHKLHVLCKGMGESQQIIQSQLTTILQLAKIEELAWHDKNIEIPESATALVDDLEIFIPLAGLINKEDELKRLTKEMDKLKKDIQIAGSRLNNENYVNKAPKEVVQKMREHLIICEQDLIKMETNFKKISLM